MIPDINLLPKVDSSQRGSNIVYLVIAVVAALLLVLLAWLYLDANLEAKKLGKEQEALTVQRDAMQKQLDELTQANAGSLKESLAFVERVSYPVTPLIDETQRLLQDNTFLRDYSFGESTVTVSIDFETLSDISRYVEKLEASDYFADAQLGSVTSFEIVREGEEATANFNEIPRYSIEVTLAIDEVYLATGGVQ